MDEQVKDRERRADWRACVMLAEMRLSRYSGKGPRPQPQDFTRYFPLLADNKPRGPQTQEEHLGALFSLSAVSKKS
jgi:hypothetical protein